MAMFIRRGGSLKDWKPLVLPEGLGLDIYLLKLLESHAGCDSDSTYHVYYEIDVDGVRIYALAEYDGWCEATDSCAEMAWHLVGTMDDMGSNSTYCERSPFDPRRDYLKLPDIYYGGMWAASQADKYDPVEILAKLGLGESRKPDSE